MAGRAQRAHRNMLENLVLFAILVVAHIAGISNELTVLGAQLSLGRLAYSLIYVIGIAWLRTAAFLVSILGLILIFLQLFDWPIHR